ncbi:MAG TPA: hypothetical protein VLB29_05670 [Nocardioidaceae bacterium]|nr:hypothetical protein [Nocardioidaceae bacterium]
MTERPVVFLHIGAMKTGTTYLQQVLIQNKAALADHGYLFPGRTWADQVRAAHDVVGHHRERGVRDRSEGAWSGVVAEILAHEGAASVVSVEFLSFAGRRPARRVVEDLAGAEVHVVLTVRDTVEVLPGLWQTHCANGGTASWHAFARSARLGAGAGPATPLLGQGARLFRRALDVPRMLDVWGPVVPPERLHLVTVPPPGSERSMLWERFASVLGLDPAVAVNPAKGHNPSLGYASADLMRRLNAELGRLPRESYNPTLKHYLAEEVLAARASQEDRARLDAAGHAFAERCNRRTRAALEASGGHVMGDLTDLPTTSAREAPPPIDPPDEQALLEAATTAFEGLERLIARRTRRVRTLADDSRAASTGGQDPRPGDGDEPSGGAEARARWADATDPVEAAVADLAALSRSAIALRERISNLRR